MLTGIQGIIFDLDDTLYLQSSYKQSGFTAVSRWLADHYKLSEKVALQHLEDILEQHGPSYPYMFNRLLEKLDLPDGLLSTLIDVFLGHSPEINCFSHSKPLLNSLRQRYSLGLLTDGRLKTQQKKIEALGLKDSFHEILMSDSLGLCKPAAELYQHFENHFKLSTSELIYVADNPAKDFVEANRRGWGTVRVLTGEFATQEVSTTMDGQLIIKNLSELPSLLGITA